MIRQLILTDFLAHRHSVIDFGPGLTVLSGPNNSGKSAIVEALRCLVTNPTPRHVIRHGAKECSVEVLLENGVRIVWRRKPRYALYEIHRPDCDPEVFAKMGRSSVPEPVAALLRLAPVELEAANTSVDVHIGNQREPIFLLDKPGSMLASFFASSTEASHLVAMQQALKNRVTQANREEKELKIRQKVLAKNLDRLRSLPDIRLLADLAADLAERMTVLERTIPGLERLLVECASRERMFAVQQMLHRVLVQTGLPPTLLAVEPLQTLVRAWRANEGHYRTCVTQHGALRALIKPADLLPVQELSAVIETMHEQIRLRRVITGRHRVVCRLSSVPSLSGVYGLADLVSRMQTGAREQAARSARRAVLYALRESPLLQSVAPVAEYRNRLALLYRQRKMLVAGMRILSQAVSAPVLSPTDDLAALLLRLKTQQDAVRKVHRSLEDSSAQLDIAREHIRIVLEKNGQCPTCGNTLSIDTFLNGEHRHA